MVKLCCSNEMRIKRDKLLEMTMKFKKLVNDDQRASLPPHLFQRTEILPSLSDLYLWVVSLQHCLNQDYESRRIAISTLSLSQLSKSASTLASLQANQELEQLVEGEATSVSHYPICSNYASSLFI